MKSVITKLTVAEKWLGVTKYDLEIHGAVVPNVIVELRTDVERGYQHVYIQSPIVDGKQILSPSTMDAVARRILPGARKYAGNVGGVVRVGRYAVR